jgi:hypothetical protein
VAQADAENEAVIAALALRHPKSYCTKKRPGSCARFPERRLRCGYIAAGAADSENCAGAFHVRGCISRQPGFRGARQRDRSSNCGTSLRFRALVSIVFLTERKYTYLTDCVYSVGEAVRRGSHPSASKCCTVLRGKARSALCRGDCRIIPSLHSTDMLGFRPKSRHSGKRADILAKESIFRQKPVPVAGPSLFGGAINGDGEIGET